MRMPRALGSRWLATGGAGALVGGLLVGAVWYASTQTTTAHALTGGPLSGLVGKVAAQEAATPTPTTPTTAPGATVPGAATPPKNTRRPTGEVVQIVTDPASFTIQTPTGEHTTYQVLDTTVFMAGHDRPYRFDLLKQGDQVIVRGGGRGEPIARIVIVRPAGEKPKRQPGQPGQPTSGPRTSQSASGQQIGQPAAGQQAKQTAAAARPRATRQKGAGNGAG